jgi:hypothetical protein
MQFMLGQGPANPSCPYDPVTALPLPSTDPNCMGDPAMVTEVPIEQFRRSYDFLVPSTYSRNVMNVVAPVGAQITLDGHPLSGSAVPIGNGYQVFFIPMTDGRHHIESARDEQRIGIKVYGIAAYTSYTYPGGLDLVPISPG